MTAQFNRLAAWGAILTFAASSALLAGCSSSDSEESGDANTSSNTSETSKTSSSGEVDLARLRGTVKIDGSSTVYPITEAVAESFNGEAARVDVRVGVSGTGGGFKKFSAGETDVSDASRPIKAAERDNAVANGIDFIEIPVAYDGLSIVVNKNNDWADELTVDDLKKIFLDGSGVTTWKDVRPEWPDRNIKIFAPGTDSGTFDYFKEVVAGKTGAIRSDMSVSEDDNVLVRGVSGDEASIGFFGCAYAFENADKLKICKIVNPATGVAVAPDANTIESGEYAPFSRPLFIYVSKAAAEKREVKAFIEYYLEHAGAMAAKVGYVGLPEPVYARARENFRTGKTGTHFLDENGEKKHGSLVDIYK